MKTYRLRRLSSGLLATQAAVHGPSGVATLQLVVDTGAIYTVVHPKFLERIGADSRGGIEVRTLERTLSLPVRRVERLSVCGAILNDYTVLAYAPAAFTPGIDGVLSIDIFHTLKARLDFASGMLIIP